MSIAIVTGASSGMGEEFCKHLDSKGYDCIWMVARREDRMEAISGRLDTPCRIIPCDFSVRESLIGLNDLISTEKPDIGMLICCAGVGYIGDTDALTTEEQLKMVDVNISSIVSIVPAVTPLMERGSSIIILCSLSAYIPMSHLAVYSSTKAFVRHYCDGLRSELSHRGISILEVSPGWVDTEFIDICKHDGKVPDKVFKGMMTREQVVDKAMRDLDAGRKRSQAGFRTRAIAFIGRHFSRLALSTWEGYWK